MGFSDLIKSISSQFKGALESLGTAVPTQKYPAGYENVTNKPSYDDGTWKSSKGYSFSVVEVLKGNTINGILPGWAEFNLQINPQELAQDEIFAIQVTPTLRGILVEHQGSTLKDITISGTTGLSPNRREGGAKSATGRPVLASGHSGFEEFNELRNYFRAYVEAKRKDSRGVVRMVFFNKRDNEKLLVEPQKFTMKRSASKPFLYEYSIQLKAIAVANGNIGEADTSLDEILGKVQVIDKAFDYLTEAQQTIEGAIGLIRRTERDIEATVLGPLRTINGALQSIRGGAAAIFGPFGITRRFIQSLELECRRIEGNLNDLLAKPLGDYNRVTGRTSTLRGPDGRQPTYQELKILNAFNAVKKASTLLLSEISFYENDANQASNNATAQYQQRTVNSQGQIVQVPNSNFQLAIPSSVVTSQIDGNDTIQTIAARTLGNPDRYKEIVILNGLKPPYISLTGGNGTLKAGDVILIPSSDGAAAPNGVKQNTQYQITKDLVHAERILGVDLRIDEDFDLVFANFGDYDLVAGLKNMAQAIVIKMGLDKGSLKRHPSVGAGLQTGVKTKNVQEIREDLVRSLRADNRIESIPFASVEQQGGTTIINMVIKVKNVRQPVPVSINV